MASLTTAAEENQLMYVSSALLGGVIAVNSKDVEAIKEKALRATMKMSGQSDEEIDKAIEESKEQLSGNAEYTALMEAAANLSSMTEEQLMEELTQADTTAFMTMMNEILSGEEMAEVTEQPGDCDAAKSYVKVTVPPEKIVEMTKALLEMIHSVPSVGAYMDALFSAADTSWDDLLKELDEADLYADDIVYEYWMTEAGELVRMTASVKINNGGEEPLPISFTMTRNTADGVATWLVTIKSAEDTAATLTFAGDLENFTANLTAYDGEDPVEINVSGKGVGTDSSVVDVEIKETVDGVEQGFGVVVTTATTMDGEPGRPQGGCAGALHGSGRCDHHGGNPHLRREGRAGREQGAGFGRDDGQRVPDVVRQGDEQPAEPAHDPADESAGEHADPADGRQQLIRFPAFACAICLRLSRAGVRVSQNESFAVHLGAFSFGNSIRMGG